MKSLVGRVGLGWVGLVQTSNEISVNLKYLPADFAAVVVGGFALDGVLSLNRHGPHPQTRLPVAEVPHDVVEGRLGPHGVSVVHVHGFRKVWLPGVQRASGVVVGGVRE